VKDVWDSKVKPLKCPLTFSINNMITEYSRIKASLFQTTLNKKILLKKNLLSKKCIQIQEKRYYFRNTKYPSKSNKIHFRVELPLEEIWVDNATISPIEYANHYNGKCYIIYLYTEESCVACMYVS
jgi:hypothetical protein